MGQHEDTPIGLKLCAEDKKVVMELLMFNEQGIKVASYNTELPEAKIIKQKLQKAISNAKARLNK